MSSTNIPRSEELLEVLKARLDSKMEDIEFNFLPEDKFDLSTDKEVRTGVYVNLSDIMMDTAINTQKIKNEKIRMEKESIVEYFSKFKGMTVEFDSETGRNYNGDVKIDSLFIDNIKESGVQVITRKIKAITKRGEKSISQDEMIESLNCILDEKLMDTKFNLYVTLSAIDHRYMVNVRLTPTEENYTDLTLDISERIDKPMDSLSLNEIADASMEVIDSLLDMEVQKKKQKAKNTQ